MGRFAVPEVVLLQLSWKEYKRNNISLGSSGYGSLKQWEDYREQLNGNWLAIMESVLRPGAWRALVSLLKVRDSHRGLHLKPGSFLVTKANKLRRHWLWSKRQRDHWKKRLKKINTDLLIKETAKCKLKYIKALGTTELNITQLGSGVDATNIALAGERFEGVLTTMLAILSGGIYSPSATKQLMRPRKGNLRFRAGPSVGSRIFSSTLDSFQPKPVSKIR